MPWSCIIRSVIYTLKFHDTRDEAERVSHDLLLASYYYPIMSVRMSQ